MKKTNIIIGVLLLIGLVGGIAYMSVQQAVTSSTFVNPDWARLECSPTDSYEGSLIKQADEQSSFICDKFTKECRLKIDMTTSSWRCNNIKVYLDNSEISWSNHQYITFKAGQTIKLTDSWCISGADFPHTQVTMEWKDWKLYRFVGGSKWVVNSANCDIKSSIKDNIRQEDYPGSKLYKDGAEGRKWINYVNAWNYGPATNVFTHSSYGEVYCNAGQIFDIVELRTEDGSLKKVDPSYSETLPNGDKISGQGTKLANVECCPNEPNCGSDFKYKQTETSCFTDSQCLNAGGPIPTSKIQYVKFVCEDSLCVQKGPFTVDCTTNAGCPTGQICDLSTMNYGKCITTKGEDYCGDGTCGLNENELTCPADCKEESKCAWYEDEVTITEKDYGALYWRAIIPFVGPKETQVAGCRTSGWVWMLGVGIIVIVLGSVAIFSMKKKGKK